MAFWRSAKKARRRFVGQLSGRGGDPALDGGAVVIVLRSEFIGPGGAFLEGVVAVPFEHQGGGAPDVDLRYHLHNLHAVTSAID